jgi:hypothetical protein
MTLLSILLLFEIPVLIETGMVEWWSFMQCPDSAAGVYLPEGHHPIIPFFQHSIIPIAELSSLYGNFHFCGRLAHAPSPGNE